MRLVVEEEEACWRVLREMSGTAGLREDRKTVAKTGKWQMEKPETHI